MEARHFASKNLDDTLCGLGLGVEGLALASASRVTALAMTSRVLALFLALVLEFWP